MEKDLKYIKEKIDLKRMKNKTVLLIGSDGFLGKWFADLFDYINITYTKYDITEGKDICNPINLPKHDFVINCAGIASPEKYTEFPVETLDVSYIGTRNVLEYCKKHEVESLLMFSSSEVYGTPNIEAIPTKGALISLSVRPIAFIIDLCGALAAPSVVSQLLCFPNSLLGIFELLMKFSL